LRYILFIFILFSSFSFYSQKTTTVAAKTPTLVKTPAAVPKKKAQPELNDFTCTLHEESVNKVLNAIGDVKGSSDYEVMLIQGTYHYTITNSRINILPDSSSFTCDVKVDVGLLDYKTQVIGDVKITYDNDSNKIYVQITRAIFELYTNVFGNKIHIKDIHLEDHFKEPFTFEGPRTVSSEFEFMMPDSTIKKIYIMPTECKMQLKYKEICTSCEIAAAEVRKVEPIKLISPIIEAPKASAGQPENAQKK
jgi:hypothetical protein